MRNVMTVVAIGYVLIALFVWWYEPRLIYHPSRSWADEPGRWGMRHEDVYLITSDGVRIHGWFLPAAVDPSEGAATVTVLMLHGNAGNLSHRLGKIALFHQLGVDVFIIDYRGYGKSEGEPDEQGTYRDAQAACEYLLGKRRIPANQIVAYGESLGTAIAVELATRSELAGLVLEAGFTSVADVGRRMFPYLPVRWMVRNRYDSLAKMNRINCPILFLHSREDEVFNLQHGQRLFETAPQPKTFVELRGGHNDAFVVSQEEYRKALQAFFRKKSTRDGVGH